MGNEVGDKDGGCMGATKPGDERRAAQQAVLKVGGEKRQSRASEWRAEARGRRSKGEQDKRDEASKTLAERRGERRSKGASRGPRGSVKKSVGPEGIIKEARTYEPTGSGRRRAATPAILESLDDIGAYMGMTTASVYKYWLKFGLPIVRMPGGRWAAHKGMLVNWMLHVGQSQRDYVLLQMRLSSGAIKVGEIDWKEYWEVMAKTCLRQLPWDLEATRPADPEIDGHGYGEVKL